MQGGLSYKEGICIVLSTLIAINWTDYEEEIGDLDTKFLYELKKVLFKKNETWEMGLRCCRLSKNY